MRIYLLNGLVIAGLLLAGSAWATEMPALAKKHDCIACHDIYKRVVGPSWMEVSEKYKGVPGIQDKLVATVSVGGYGNWGKMPMPPMAPGVPEKDIRTLIRFILDLSK